MDRSAVEKVINERLKPALEGHGGGIELVDVKDNIISVRLVGACGCCPHAQMTMKTGVEQVLREEFPDVKDVIAVEQ